MAKLSVFTEYRGYVNGTKPSGSISILNNNGAGIPLMVISDVYSPKGVRTVQIPVWFEADGQDDIRWYERQSNWWQLQAAMFK